MNELIEWLELEQDTADTAAAESGDAGEMNYWAGYYAAVTNTLNQVTGMGE